MTKQIRFEPKKTTFIEGSSSAYGAKYHNAQDAGMRRIIVKDLARILAPLGAVIEGKSRAEVEALIEESDRIHQYYVELAREAIGRKPALDEPPKVIPSIDSKESDDNFGDLFQ